MQSIELMKGKEMIIDVELKRLQGLRDRHAAVTASIAKSRDVIAKCIREIGEARIAGVLNDEAMPAKESEALRKKLESQCELAEAEIKRLTPDADALSMAIRHVESEMVPLSHAKRLARQAEVRGQYRALAARILETVNTLALLSGHAQAAFQSAQREFPRDESLSAHATVLRYSGLREIWDHAWTGYHGAPSRRDVAVERIFSFDPSLVAVDDPVAIRRNHEEKHRIAEYERHENERRLRNNPTREDIAGAKAAALERGEEWHVVVHPLSSTGSWKPDAR